MIFQTNNRKLFSIEKELKDVSKHSTSIHTSEMTSDSSSSSSKSKTIAKKTIPTKSSKSGNSLFDFKY